MTSLLSALGDIGKVLHGVEAQINPFDGGANYQSVVNPSNGAAPVQQPMGVPRPAAAPRVPVGQPLSPQDISRLAPNVQGLANIYNQNPQDPRVSHIDPAMFGYAPDNTVRPPRIQPPHLPMIYNQDGIQSIGGTAGGFGGTIGLDHGVPFGSVNRNGKIFGQFGPQG